MINSIEATPALPEICAHALAVASLAKLSIKIYFLSNSSFVSARG